MAIPIDLSGVRDGAHLTYRPAGLDDIDVVLALLVAANIRDTGEEQVDAGDLLGDWQRPSFDLGSESVLVLDRDRVVAYGEVYGGHRADGYVHPEERGRGLGAALARWTWEVARSRGSVLVSQAVPVPSDAVPLLETLGYAPTHTAWLFELPAGAELKRSPLPPGVALRGLRPGVDELAAYEVIEAAFSEWAERHPSTFGDWEAGSVRRPGYEPWSIQLAWEEGPDGPRAVGAVHVIESFGDAWVNQVAVRRDRRGLGLGGALLVHALDVARAHLGPHATLGLATDTRTGARGLYEHVGMAIKQTYVHYAKSL